MAEQLITADFVEVLDSKIITSNDHPQIGSLVGDTLAVVLGLLNLTSITQDQQEAFNAALTVPSGSNPVVLEDDLPTYYPPPSLGSIKDSVATFGALPGAGNTIDDIRSVLADNTLYIWDGATWNPLIETGTLDHTQLTNQNGDTNFQHITSAEKISLLAASHSHTNQTELDLITNAGSTIIISTSERNRLPTADEKAALLGTIAPASVVNRYVNHLDPRLNTLINPYITFGPIGSGSSFVGDIVDLKAAFTAIETGGAADNVKAIEVLPGFFDLNCTVTDFVQWANEEAPVQLVARALGETTFKFNTGTPSIEIVGPGSGGAKIQGINFELDGASTEGILLDRDDCIIEDCTFTLSFGNTLLDLIKGILVVADNCVIRRCRFIGALATAIEITGSRCQVEECVFTLDTASLAIDLQAPAANCTLSYNKINSGVLAIGAAVSQTLIDALETSSFVLDGGDSTRILDAMAPDHQQPYLAETRTIGPTNSFADYRGLNETPFLDAIVDPIATEFEVLPGIYTFTSTVILPAGVKIRGGEGVVINASAGVIPFIVDSDTLLQSLTINSVDVPTIVLGGTVSTTFKDCTLTLSSPNSADDFAIFDNGSIGLTITGCTFTGFRGLRLDGTTAQVSNNRFSTVAIALEMNGASYACKIEDNYFIAGSITVAGSSHLFLGNHFLVNTPSKAGANDTLWKGNYPHPAANNATGLDILSIALNGSIEPSSAGVARTIVAGLGGLTFDESVEATAAALQLPVPILVDQTSGFDVELKWTATVFSGAVLWEAVIVFRDQAGAVLAPALTQTLLAPRTGLSVIVEESSTISFPASYGLTEISHVGVLIKRIGIDLTDTMAGGAHLLEATINLPVG